MLVLILNLNRINIQTRAFVQALEGGVPSFGLQVYAHFGMEIVWYSGRCMLEQYLDEFGWVHCVSGVAISFKYNISMLCGVYVCLRMFVFVPMCPTILFLHARDKKRV